MSGLKSKVVRQRGPTEDLAYALRTRVPEMVHTLRVIQAVR